MRQRHRICFLAVLSLLMVLLLDTYLPGHPSGQLLDQLRLQGLVSQVTNGALTLSVRTRNHESNQAIKSGQLTPRPTPTVAMTTGNASNDSPVVIQGGLVRIVHQSWKTSKLPTKRTERWSASWKACFPDWEHRLWTDADNLALVQKYYAWFLPVYQGFAYGIERADLARYFYLYHYGGMYTDLDTICVRNFTSLLRPSSLIFGGMDEKTPGDGVLPGLVQNSFMAAMRPRHPFWLRLLQRIERNFKAGKRGRPESNTGPGVLMEELREYRRTNASDLLLYPGRLFNPFSWVRDERDVCKDFGRMSDEEEKKCVASFPQAYVVQLHTQSWGRGRM